MNNSEMNSEMLSPEQKEPVSFISGEPVEDKPPVFPAVIEIIIPPRTTSIDRQKASWILEPIRRAIEKIVAYTDLADKSFMVDLGIDELVHNIIDHSDDTKVLIEISADGFFTIKAQSYSSALEDKMVPRGENLTSERSRGSDILADIATVEYADGKATVDFHKP